MIYNVTCNMFGKNVRIFFTPSNSLEEIKNPIHIKTTTGTVVMDYIGNLNPNTDIFLDSYVIHIIESLHFLQDFNFYEYCKFGTNSNLPYELFLDPNFHKNCFSVVSDNYWDTIFIYKNKIITYQVVPEHTLAPIGIVIPKTKHELKERVCQTLIRSAAAGNASGKFSRNTISYVYNRYSSVENLWEEYKKCI